MLEPHETTAARLPQPRTYLKPYAPVPSLSGASMSPRAWNLSESRELPLSAPELIKPNPNRERTTTSRYDIDAELIDPEKIIPAPAPPGGVTFAPGSIAPASSAQALAPAPPPSKAAAADGGDPSKVVVEVPQPPPLTAVEQALASGHLSGARVCQMLLQGEMSAASFGRALAAMPMEYLPFWLDGFGRCVALLGETIELLSVEAAGWEELEEQRHAQLLTLRRELGEVERVLRAAEGSEGGRKRRRPAPEVVPPVPP